VSGVYSDDHESKAYQGGIETIRGSEIETRSSAKEAQQSEKKD